MRIAVPFIVLLRSGFDIILHIDPTLDVTLGFAPWIETFMHLYLLARAQCQP
jgi:hypothetical protein